MKLSTSFVLLGLTATAVKAIVFRNEDATTIVDLHPGNCPCHQPAEDIRPYELIPSNGDLDHEVIMCLDKAGPDITAIQRCMEMLKVPVQHMVY